MSCGSVREASKRVARWRFSWSSSLAGNDGSRSTSAVSRSTSASCPRYVWPDALAPVCVPLMPTLARSLSNASSISWRDFFVVPRVSMPPVTAPIADLPATDFSSPKRSVMLKFTDSPRVFFGSSATFMPLGSAKRCARASRLAGDGSNDSPAATAVSPL